MRLRIIALSMLIAAFFFSLNADEAKYKSMKLLSKGWIKGRVTHSPATLDVPNLEVNYDMKLCGSEPRKIEAVELGQDGGLKNSVVYLKNITTGKPFNLPGTPPTLAQARCRYEPHVQVVPLMTSIRITNDDQILHSVHAFQYEYGRKFVIYPNSITYPANTLFNVAMVPTHKEMYEQLNTPGIVKFICDAGHYWMTAYAVVASNPYFVKVNDDGTYVLEDVPPGKYKLVSWHEYFGTQEQDIVVKENQPTTVDFTYREEL